MIGMVTLKVDPRPHCTNGWGGAVADPSCNYTGGHFCGLLAAHEGKCRCPCGSTADYAEEPLVVHAKEPVHEHG
jgi:hypothetical protein